jgi:hypothetical protein
LSLCHTYIHKGRSSYALATAVLNDKQCVNGKQVRGAAAGGTLARGFAGLYPSHMPAAGTPLPLLPLALTPARVSRPLEVARHAPVGNLAKCAGLLPRPHTKHQSPLQRCVAVTVKQRLCDLGSWRSSAIACPGRSCPCRPARPPSASPALPQTSRCGCTLVSRTRPYPPQTNTNTLQTNTGPTLARVCS